MKHGRPRLRLGLESSDERLCLGGSVGRDGTGRGVASLTYFIGNAPASPGQTAVNAAIRKALGDWSAVVNIRFTQATAPNQLRSFDVSSRWIDGSNGTLARACFPDDTNSPRIAGDAQVESSGRWEVGRPGPGRGARDRPRAGARPLPGGRIGHGAVDLLESVVHEPRRDRRRRDPHALRSGRLVDGPPRGHGGHDPARRDR